MASRLRTPTLASACLSMCLTLATIGTAGRSLYVYQNQHTTNEWLLPLWRDHFDTRELEMLIGTSATIFVLNAILAMSILIPALPANILVFGSAFVSTLVSIASIVFSTVINNRAPNRETLQTWTCRWSSTYVVDGERAPEQFQGLCHKTRFAYYSTIPILVIQVTLMVIGLYAIFARRHDAHHDLEKTQGHQLHNVGNARQASFDSKSESPTSVQANSKMYGAAK